MIPYLTRDYVCVKERLNSSPSSVNAAVGRVYKPLYKYVVNVRPRFDSRIPFMSDMSSHVISLSLYFKIVIRY